jgi:hypothetical protein
MQFEGTYVPYMLNQAKMCFAVVANYPHYKVEDGKMVKDNGLESQELRQTAIDTYDLIKKMIGKTQAGARIPRTWIRRLQDQETLVLVLRKELVVHKDWADQFQRTLRFFSQTAN